MDTPIDVVPIEHALGSVHRRRCPTCPFGSPGPRPRRFKGSPAHVSTLSGPADYRRHPAGSPRSTAWRSGGIADRESRRLSATGIRFLGILSRRGIPPLSRSAYRTRRPGPDGVSTFHAHEIRPGRAPSIPRGQRCSHDRPVASGRRLPPLPAARPYHPGSRSRLPGLSNNEASSEGSLAFARPVFPSPGCSPGRNGGPWASPSSFAPPRAGPVGRTSRRGPISNTDQELRTRHRRPPIHEFTHMRDFVSHPQVSIIAPPAAYAGSDHPQARRGQQTPRGPDEELNEVPAPADR